MEYIICILRDHYKGNPIEEKVLVKANFQTIPNFADGFDLTLYRLRNITLISTLKNFKIENDEFYLNPEIYPQTKIVRQEFVFIKEHIVNRLIDISDDESAKLIFEIGE